MERLIGKPHPHAVGFGGEEGIEELVEILGIDPHARVPDCDRHLTAHRFVT